MATEELLCPHCGTLWRSEASQDLILEDQRCPACRAPMAFAAPELHPRRVGIDGAVEVLDEAPARLEEVGFLDEAALLDRVFEAQRAEARQMRARARQMQAEARGTRKRLGAQRGALRWTVRRIARRDALSTRQRQLLVELHEELRRAEKLLGPDA